MTNDIPSAHISASDLQDFVMGHHESLELNKMSEHIRSCETCSNSLTVEARTEVAIRDVAESAPYCQSCQHFVEGSRCSHCGAVSGVRGYEIERILVQNSHGRMYLARNEEGRQVALKELAFVQTPSTDELSAFERESTILRTLSYPTIPRFLEAFQEGDGVETRLYLAQEYIDGQSLSERFEVQQFSEKEAHKIVNSVLQTLVYLQSLSPMVFHRDIKPANLMYRDNDSIAVVDFGAARSLGATAGATLVGTFGYMPVEQLGGIVDATTDVYALGISLCHLLTRREPWQLMEDRKLLDRMNVSAPLRDVITKMVAPKRSDRYQSAAEALAALDTMDKVHASKAQADSPDRTSRLPGTGLRLWLAAAAVVVLGIGVGMFLSTGESQSSPPTSDTADIPSSETKGPAKAALGATIEIASNVPATIHLGSNILGKTPIQIAGLPLKEHQFTASRPGYKSETAAFIPAVGQHSQVLVNLIPTKVNQAGEFQRIAGVRRIHPNHEAIAQMSNTGMSEFVFKVNVCVEADGTIKSANTIANGHRNYEAMLETKIKASWIYQPMKTGGCTVATLIYNLGEGR